MTKKSLPETSAPRDETAEMTRRSEARRALVAARPVFVPHTFASHPGFSTASAARAAVTKVAMPGTAFAAIPRPADGLFVPVVVLRLDQRWMRERLAERGLVVLDEAEQAEIIRRAGL